MTSSINKGIFFIILGIIFIVFFYATGFFYMQVRSGSSFKKNVIIFIAAIIFSLFFIGYSEITGLFKEGFEVSQSPGAKLCRGGPYMWQGDSEIAKYCRSLAATPEGKAEIDSYECGKGYNGMPGNGFKDTPMSNSCWKNEMCTEGSDYLVRSNGIF